MQTTQPTEIDARLQRVLLNSLVVMRRTVDIGNYRFRVLRAGDQFEQDGETMQAMESGLYGRLPVSRGNQVIGGRWMHLGSSDNLVQLLRDYLPTGQRERDMLAVSISASATLQGGGAQQRRGAEQPIKPEATTQLPTEIDTRLQRVLLTNLVVMRRTVDIGDYRFRVLRAGEEFEEGDQVMQAMESGLYGRFPVQRGDEVVGGRWMHMGSSDNLMRLLADYLPVEQRERDMLAVGISGSAALQGLAAERRRPRP